MSNLLYDDDFDDYEDDDEEEGPDLGMCCGCSKTEGVRNIVMLNFTHPEAKGKGWGCFTCGLPMDGVSAVLCDDCLDKQNIIFFCIGYPSENHRGLKAELTEVFGHDMSKHQEQLYAEDDGSEY
jgi:hypothetical protein